MDTYFNAVEVVDKITDLILAQKKTGKLAKETTYVKQMVTVVEDALKQARQEALQEVADKISRLVPRSGERVAIARCLGVIRKLAALEEGEFKPNPPPCKKCSGLGEYPGFSNELSRCPSCSGTGYSEEEDND